MRAIILAAGMGTRLRPLTDDRPKGLVEVNGIPMVENTINKLKEKEIDEIIVVTGYLGDKFNYLEDKYGVTLIHNDKYDKYNNIYTMYLVKDYLADAFVMDSDIYMNSNFFSRNIKNSTYFSALKSNFKNEWILKTDENDKVVEVIIGTEPQAYINSGMSYWTEKDGMFIADKVKEAIDGGEFKDLYWDDIVKDNLDRLVIDLVKLEEDDIFEIDSIEDLNFVEKVLSTNK